MLLLLGRNGILARSDPLLLSHASGEPTRHKRVFQRLGDGQQVLRSTRVNGCTGACASSGTDNLQEPRRSAGRLTRCACRAAWVSMAAVVLGGCVLYHRAGLERQLTQAHARGASILIYALGTPGDIESRYGKLARRTCLYSIHCDLVSGDTVDTLYVARLLRTWMARTQSKR